MHSLQIKKKLKLLFVIGIITSVTSNCLSVVTSLETTPPEWQNQAQDHDSILANDSTLLSSQGRDETALSYAYLSTNESGVWQDLKGLIEWNYVRKITIDHTLVKEDLTDFPILVHLTDATLSTHAQPDGDDFIFYDATNTTKFSHEIESYDSSTGALVAWVKIPFLTSSTDTIISMYYGNPRCSNQQDGEATWSNGYVMVHHMTGFSIAALLDSTSSNFDITKQGDSPLLNQPGKVGGCVEFDGSNDYLQAGGFSLHNGSHTTSAWVYYTGTFLNDGFIFAGNGTTSRVMTPSTMVHTMRKYRSYIVSPSNSSTYITSTTQPGGSWQYITSRADSVAKKLRIYVNGADEGEVLFGKIKEATNGLNIGMSGTNTYWYKGKIDELRISNVLRSDGWIETEYNTMSNPAFLSIGPEQVAAGTGGAYGSPLILLQTNQWQWSNFTWHNPTIAEGSSVGWKITYVDTSSNEQSTDIKQFKIDNSPTQPSVPTGITAGFIQEDYTFSTSQISDPDGDTVQAQFDWGDGSCSDWTTSQAAPAIFTQTHQWQTPGVYSIKIRAKDSLGAISLWSEAKTIRISSSPLPVLTVSMPKSVVEATPFLITVTNSVTPVPAASVLFINTVYTTGENGSVVLTAPSINTDTIYPIVVTHPNYQTLQTSITILNQRAEEIDKGWIYGQVFRSNGQPLSEADICARLVSTPELTSCVTTDDQGSFHVLVPVGTYEVTAEKNGFEQKTQTGIIVYKNEAVEANFVLLISTASKQPPALSENRDIIEAAISAGISANLVGGEINVQTNTTQYNLTLHNDELAVDVVSMNQTDLTFTVDAKDLPKTILAVRLYNPNAIENMQVFYDGAPIDTVDLVGIFQSADNTSTARYAQYVVSDEQGAVGYCLVYVPHFSGHEISIHTMYSVGETLGGITTVLVYIATACTAVTVLVIPFLVSILRRRRFF